MAGERIDDETLAAFIDGRLSPAEREAVLRAAAANPETYRSLTESAQLLGMLEGAAPSAVAGMMPPQRRGPSRRMQIVVAGSLLAASLAAIAVWSGTTRRTDLAPATLADRLVLGGRGPGALAAALGDQWDRPGWPATRGDPGSVSPGALSLRLGVRAVDVDLAIRTGDRTALALVGGDLLTLAEGAVGSGPAVAIYRRLMSDSNAAPRTDRAAAAAALRAIAEDPSRFDLGAWLEWARLTLAAGHVAAVNTAASELDVLVSRLRAHQPAAPNSIGPPLEALTRQLSRPAAPGDAAAISGLIERVVAAAQ